ncbi:unknown protein [Waddlia chondrophila 2032/99]|uniref:Uncharacterized protein n=1 Tax=Waddlia chondrophila 2032/99 TaxID=765953 RepID=F8LBZ0_9BACT|nr:unknown protein [Waddlia chondrophila 2032/99]
MDKKDKIRGSEIVRRVLTLPSRTSRDIFLTDKYKKKIFIK